MARSRPRLTPNWARSMARYWCHQHCLSECVADVLADVFLRFGIRDSDSLERQIRVRGVEVPKGYGPVIGRFGDYADACVREAGWNWVWRAGVVPPFPVGTLLEQGLIVGIDDIEPAAYRVRLDGLPSVPADDTCHGGDDAVVCTTPQDRASANHRQPKAGVRLIAFESAIPLEDQGYVLA